MNESRCLNTGLKLRELINFLTTTQFCPLTRETREETETDVFWAVTPGRVSFCVSRTRYIVRSFLSPQNLRLVHVSSKSAF